MGNGYITIFSKLMKDEPETNLAIMMTLLKVATKYYKDNKKLYIPKWNDFFCGLFPNATFTFKQKEGPKVPALSDAVAYLCEKGFGKMVEVSGKDYRLFTLNKDNIERINNALDKDSLTDAEDELLGKSIDDFYAVCEKSKSSASSKLSFDNLFS